MACTDPRHADCPNCDGEILVGAFSPLNVKTIDRVTGEVTREVASLPRHVLVPQCCPHPLVPKEAIFRQALALVEAGEPLTPHLSKTLTNFRRREVPVALGGYAAPGVDIDPD